MPYLKLIYFIPLVTLVALPFCGNAAEVISTTNTPSNKPSNSTHIRTLDIRTLAASCAACHGANGNSAGITPTLAGLDSAYFIAQMLAYKDGSRPATVMHHHAKGLNVDEINLLAHYFSQQKRVANNPPNPQTLKADHAN